MASSLGAATADAPRCVATMTLRVRVLGATRTWLRCRVARYWLVIGAWLIGCQFALDNEEDDTDVTEKS